MKSTIKTYEQARQFLGSKKERPYAHNTRIELDSLDMGHEVITVKYHGNPVVNFFPDGTVTFSSCGWRTLTTKERINWFLPDGFRLYQEKSTWYICSGRWDNNSIKSYIFADGIAIKSGEIYNYAPDSEQDAIKKQIKRIKAYVDGFTSELLSGNVPAPDSGDCWYCLMHTQDGESLGDAAKTTDHLESHMDESYYVPSLLVNAIEKTGRACDFTKDGIARIWKGESISDWQKSIVERDVKSCLTKYMKHAFGIANH